MKIKNKGKVYPSPSSSSSSSSGDIDVLSVLKLLPAAILALVSVLSFEDREVLAYMITRSMKTSAATSSMAVQESKKRSSKKGSNYYNDTHKPPVFDCDCFDCYTSYWLKWNSSSHRELMDQAIEAFEDQLTSGEKKTQKSSGRGRRRDKMGRREAMKAVDVKVQPSVAMPETVEDCGGVLPAENAVIPVSSPEKSDGVEGKNGKQEDEEVVVVVEAMGEELSQAEEEGEDMAVFVRTPTANYHKGLARKVLPDVLGLLNSRFWSLWGPNV